jgi:hypothetical protein
MKENPLLKLEHFGQSIWMDFIRRGMFVSGELKQLIEEDGLCLADGFVGLSRCISQCLAAGQSYPGSA